LWFKKQKNWAGDAGKDCNGRAGGGSPKRSKKKVLRVLGLFFKVHSPKAERAAPNMIRGVPSSLAFRRERQRRARAKIQKESVGKKASSSQEKTDSLTPPGKRRAERGKEGGGGGMGSHQKGGLFGKKEKPATMEKKNSVTEGVWKV